MREKMGRGEERGIEERDCERERERWREREDVRELYSCPSIVFFSNGGFLYFPRRR